MFTSVFAWLTGAAAYQKQLRLVRQLCYLLCYIANRELCLFVLQIKFATHNSSFL